MKTHIFLMQVHKDPQLLNRILKSLRKENHYFIINVDAKSLCAVDMLNVINAEKNIVCITRENIMHGGFSQVLCTMKQIYCALDYNIRFDYFHTISGQDYPCCSMDQFDDFFEKTDKSYMMMESVEELAEWREKKYKHRLNHWYFMDIFNSPMMSKYHVAGILRRLFYFFPRRKINMNQIYGGWNWFSLKRDVIEYVTEFWENNYDFIKRFRYTTSSDELIFSSILYPKAALLNIEKRNSLRYIVWKPKREYGTLPLILEESEYDEILSSGALICRKVDLEHSSRLLDLLDEHNEC